MSKRNMPPIHPAANLFPMLPDAELRSLADDIKANGLQQPIVMFGAQLLDGRNRWRACEIADVEPKVRDWSGASPTAFVLSVNARRRHLTPSQLAAVAVEALPMFEAEAKKRQKEHGGTAPGRSTSAKNCGSEAREAAAGALGTNRQYVSDVKAMAKTSPQLVERIKSGELTVPEAKALSSLKREEQGEVLRKMETGEARSAKEGIRQVNRAERITRLEKESAPLDLGRKFSVLLADPPWRYGDSDSRGAAEDHYPTMSTEEICALPVADHATKDAVLFMWTTSTHLHEAFAVLEAWGFEYRASAIWVKPRMGLGHWFRIRHEIVLVAVRGNFPAPAPGDQADSVFTAPNDEHSRKPDHVHRFIEEAWPSLSRLELFARAPRLGWEVWGNQAKGDAV